MWCVANLDEDYVARWKTCWRRMNSPTIPKSRWCAWTRSRSHCKADVRPASAAEPGREARRDSEYERHGRAVEPKVGRHFTFPMLDRSGFELAQVAFHLAPSRRSSRKWRHRPDARRGVVSGESAAGLGSAQGRIPGQQGQHNRGGPEPGR